MATEITGNEDVLDSRDIIERLDELQNELDALEAEEITAQEALDDWIEPEELDRLDDFKHQKLTEALAIAQLKITEWQEEYCEEYTALKALDDDGSSYAPDWSYGEQLIANDYFETYARELASDIGAINPDLGWPLNHIDWDAAADDLKLGYSSSNFLGTTYFYRTG